MWVVALVGVLVLVVSTSAFIWRAPPDGRFQETLPGGAQVTAKLRDGTLAVSELAETPALITTDPLGPPIHVDPKDALLAGPATITFPVRQLDAGLARPAVSTRPVTTTASTTSAGAAAKIVRSPRATTRAYCRVTSLAGLDTGLIASACSNSAVVASPVFGPPPPAARGGRPRRTSERDPVAARAHVHPGQRGGRTPHLPGSHAGVAATAARCAGNERGGECRAARSGQPTG